MEIELWWKQNATEKYRRCLVVLKGYQQASGVGLQAEVQMTIDTQMVGDRATNTGLQARPGIDKHSACSEATYAAELSYAML